MNASLRRPCDHALDILDAWLDWREEGPVALVLLTETQGGAVRAPGALMAVAEDGRVAGYLSGGCIDADAARQAVDALSEGVGRRVRYGAGSPYQDLPLPCGGSLDLAVLPQADADVVRAARDALAQRVGATLILDADLRLTFGTPSDGFSGDMRVYHYAPKLRLRIAGRGEDGLAMARLASAAGVDVQVGCVGSDVSAVTGSGGVTVEPLTNPRENHAVQDDPWTAFVSLFHDAEWETPLLEDALRGPAFYVGAVGSARTHAMRCERLRASGFSEADVRRVHGPIGLIPSTRDATMLAVSAFAEVAARFQEWSRAPLDRTALVLLAAGQGRRFPKGDKLLAPLNGRHVLAHAGDRLRRDRLAARIAVVGAQQAGRARLGRDLGWEIVIQPEPEDGQASSLAIGGQAAAEIAGADAAMVILGDMPFVQDRHLRRLQERFDEGGAAVVSRSSYAKGPPALFSKRLFSDLQNLRGDEGARAVIRARSDVVAIPLPDDQARDIDTMADLERAEALVAHA